MFGAVFVAAIDGKSAFITSCECMPRKNNIPIYRDVFKYKKLNHELQILKCSLIIHRKTIETYGRFEQVVVDCGKEFFLPLYIQHYLSPLRPCARAPYKQVQSMKVHLYFFVLNEQLIDKFYII